jgi:hypothetical protein
MTRLGTRGSGLGKMTGTFIELLVVSTMLLVLASAICAHQGDDAADA